MKVLKPYHQLFDPNNHQIIMKSGRDAGKSTALYQLVVHNLFKYDLDIIFGRNALSDMRDSVFNGIIKFAESEGYHMFLDTYTRPLKIVNRLNGNTVWFKGVGGSDLERTKSFEPNKKCSLFIVDEAQQLPRKENLDQAWATFRRHLDNVNWKYVLAFNPKRQASHWLNEEYRVLESEDDWLCIHPSYKDIANILTDIDLRAIRREMVINPSNYRYLYLGETEGLFGAVYYTFQRDYHCIKPKEAKELIKKWGVHNLIIGVDGATTRDKTAFIPTLILNNGQGIVLDYLYHDPEKYGALSNQQLMPYVNAFLDFMHTKWNLPRNMRIEMIFDSASADLRLTCSYNLPSRYNCVSYSQKNVIQMAHIMQNSFSANVLFIVDEGGIYNYVTSRQEYGFHPLITQLETVIWDEKGKGFDPTIPNDCTDALTYSTAFYFKNPNALSFPNRLDYYERSGV